MDKDSLLREGFFSRGETIACFKDSGKIPVDSERLISLVIGGASTCTHFLSKKVGMGSRAHCLLGELRMRSETSASDTGVYSDRMSGM